tara:strand:+ start:29 stop:373 length:345 start_codon:yes stop_codon:yes gene_type:complete
MSDETTTELMQQYEDEQPTEDMEPLPPETMELLPNVAYLCIYEASLGEIGIEFNHTPGALSPTVQQTALGLFKFLSTEEGRNIAFEAGASLEQPEVIDNDISTTNSDAGHRDKS